MLILIVYTYVLFPLLIFLRGALWPRPYNSSDHSPRVSFIIAAYNEADNIKAKLENIFSLDYPTDRLEVVIASDGSTDNTCEIAESFAKESVTVLDLPRQGKAPTLTTAVEASTGEILVFSDADSVYAQGALRALVQPFSDPAVGGVAGNQRYLTEESAISSSAGERSYWSFDRMLKHFQSRAGNVTSAAGSIYAIRRSLFAPVPVGVTDDFVTSTRVIAQGYRLVFAPDALAFHPVTPSSTDEFRRKVRVISRGLRGVLVMRELLNPFRHAFYSLQLFTHKILRRAVVLPLLVLALVSPLVWQRGLFYQLVTLGQLVLYSLGILGLLLRSRRIGQLKIFTLPFYFCVVNAASLLAIWNLVRGHRIGLWEPQRQGVA